MKTLLVCLFFVSSVTAVYAGTKQEFQSATVVSVANHQPVTIAFGDNPADAPLRAEVHAYDIGIRLNCTAYVVRYETGLDYLPSVFAPGHAVEVNPQKHVMWVRLS